MTKDLYQEYVKNSHISKLKRQPTQFKKKMDKRHKQPFKERRYANGQKSHRNVFDIINQ